MQAKCQALLSNSVCDHAAMTLILVMHLWARVGAKFQSVSWSSNPLVHPLRKGGKPCAYPSKPFIVMYDPCAWTHE